MAILDEHRLTAMIGEQEYFIRDMLRVILEKSGFHVVAEAENGIEAVAKYSETRPDVALIDVILPMKNGVEVTKEILSLDDMARVIMCSTRAHLTIARTGMDAGAVDILFKPYRIEQVREILQKLRPIKLKKPPASAGRSVEDTMESGEQAFPFGMPEPDTSL